MKTDISRTGAESNSLLNIDAVAALIAETQLTSGEIPWSQDQKTDPWDHIEAAMGLSIGGYFAEAQRAFEWLVDMQLPDGSWYAAYKTGVPQDKTRDANISSYIAVGVLHYYLITGDISILKKMWPTIAGAIEFTLSLQTSEGEIYWAINPEGKIDPMALLTGSSSIYMSLKCAIAIAKQLGRSVPAWEIAFGRLGEAIRHKPHLFNMTKSRFSMDWFYPILAGAVTGDEARKRIDQYWKKFVVRDKGVRCVSDEPWVTIAETSELVLALTAMGNFDLARIVFSWIGDWKYEDGTYWCGFTYPDMVIWPEDKLTWTNAVVLMAADAIYNLTPAAKIFNHQFWNHFELSPFVGPVNTAG